MHCYGDLCGSISQLRDAFRRRIALFRGDSSRSWLGRKEYWDAAYASGRYKQSYEWNQTCETIWPYVTQMLGTRLDSAVLHVGCGNSQLGRLLHNAGFQHVVNVDYSEVVIAMMQQKEPSLCFICADCAEPGALGSAECYDFALDKGAIDSLFESCRVVWLTYDLRSS
ncbi:unnamed protein product [Durusdinium trenchii]|uniref:Methyltransferase type 11 domain-containing protein n=1 Tax=Durusdinium trenchii TaxID=1381693 RepID=A0ABP0QMD3_9DINO